MSKKRYTLNLDFFDYSHYESDSKEIQKNMSEIVVKKSIFIGKVFAIEKKEDVEYVINYLKIKHPDAKHICYAYILNKDGGYHEDFEPKNSSAKPIYKMMEKEKYSYLLIAVIRYFGGVLLGRGLLARTYLKAAKDVAAMYEKIEIVDYEKITLNFEYKEEKQINHLIKKTKSKYLSIKREEKIQMTIKVPKEKIEYFSKYI